MDMLNPDQVVFLSLIFGTPACFITKTPMIIIMGLIISMIGNLISGIYCSRNKKKKGIVSLYLGIVSLSYSLIFFLDALAIVVYMTRESKKIEIITIMILVYILEISCYLIFDRWLIRKVEHKKVGRKTSAKAAYLLGTSGMFGIFMGKSLFKGATQSQALIGLVVCCMVMSLAFTLGISNLLKFYYISKTKE